MLFRPDPWQDRAGRWLLCLLLVWLSAVLVAAAMDLHQPALLSVATVAIAYWTVEAVGQVVGGER